MPGGDCPGGTTTCWSCCCSGPSVSLLSRARRRARQHRWLSSNAGCPARPGAAASLSSGSADACPSVFSLGSLRWPETCQWHVHALWEDWSEQRRRRRRLHHFQGGVAHGMKRQRVSRPAMQVGAPPPRAATSPGPLARPPRLLSGLCAWPGQYGDNRERHRRWPFIAHCSSHVQASSVPESWGGGSRSAASAGEDVARGVLLCAAPAAHLAITMVVALTRTAPPAGMVDGLRA